MKSHAVTSKVGTSYNETTTIDRQEQPSNTTAITKAAKKSLNNSGNTSRRQTLPVLNTEDLDPLSQRQQRRTIEKSKNAYYNAPKKTSVYSRDIRRIISELNQKKTAKSLSSS